LLARSWRRAELTYAAVLHLVVATYIVLFNIGHNDPSMAYVFGLSAVVEGIVLWAVGFACRRWGDAPARSWAQPLFHCTVGLTALGITLADRSSVTLVLAAVAFLLTVKSLEHAGWLYAAVAALALGVYFRWLSALAPIELVAFATCAAFVL